MNAGGFTAMIGPWQAQDVRVVRVECGLVRLLARALHEHFGPVGGGWSSGIEGLELGLAAD